MRERETDGRVQNPNNQTGEPESGDNWDEIVQSVIAEIDDPQGYVDGHGQAEDGQ